MNLGRAIKRKVKAVLPATLFLSLVAYFTWNAYQGDHGLKSYTEQLRVLAQAQNGKSAALSEYAAWDRRVAGLRDHGLDADILDERSRAMLNLAESNDIVIPYAANQRLY